jgi:hypothetical protein
MKGKFEGTGTKAGEDWAPPDVLVLGTAAHDMLLDDVQAYTRNLDTVLHTVSAL